MAYCNHLKPQELKAAWFVWFQKFPGLFHFLDARESPVSPILPFRSRRFQHIWSGQHGDVGHMPLFPKVGLVEHILCVGCGHKQELVPANPASVDGRRFKRRHHSFDLEWLFRRLRNHYHFAVIIAEDPCIYDVNLSDPDEFRIFLWGKSRLTTKCLNPGSFQLPVTLHQHAAKFVVEVAKDGLTHGIFGIHLLIFAIHIFVITCQGQV